MAVPRPVCPQCAESGRAWALGNGRYHCQTCNRYARRLQREIAHRLREEVPEDRLAQIEEDSARYVLRAMNFRRD